MLVAAVLAVRVLVVGGPVAVVAELASAAAAVPLAVARQVLVLPLAVVSVAGRLVLAPVVGVVVARPVLSAGLVVPRARAASPSAKSARNSTTCRRRR
jgi:hypothetical protein